MGEIDWSDTTECIPAAITVIIIPFTYSIAEGIAFGFITYAALKLATGRARQVAPIVWIIAALFRSSSRMSVVEAASSFA
jgi:AGZA family xanthine/uracil permease-like MFS transporter